MAEEHAFRPAVQGGPPLPQGKNETRIVVTVAKSVYAGGSPGAESYLWFGLLQAWFRGERK